MKHTYLVTGAAGFIGAAIARRLISEGHRVVTIDNMSTGSKSSIPEGVTLIQGDCQDAAIIEQLNIYRFHAIYHIAGQSSGEVSFEDPVYDLQTNTQSTLQLLRCCLDTGCKNFIYASSMSVYGDHEELPVDESSSCTPKSFYAVGKLASENYLRIFSQFGIKTTALRFFNVYGPGQNLQNMKQGMVSIFLTMAITKKSIHVKGDSKRFRDFIYIDDLVDAVLKSENRSGNEFEVLNLCSGTKVEVRQLVEALKSNISGVKTVSYSGSTPGDQFGIYGSPRKAQDVLDWSCKVPFQEGVKQMCDWAIQNNKTL